MVNLIRELEPTVIIDDEVIHQVCIRIWGAAARVIIRDTFHLYGNRKASALLCFLEEGSVSGMEEKMRIKLIAKIKILQPDIL